MLPGSGNLNSRFCATRPNLQSAALVANTGNVGAGACVGCQDGFRELLFNAVQPSTARSARTASVAVVTPTSATILICARVRPPDHLTSPRFAAGAWPPREGRCESKVVPGLRYVRTQHLHRCRSISGGSAFTGRRVSRCELQFMRWDEHGWDEFCTAPGHRHPGPASTRRGNIVAYNYTSYQPRLDAGDRIGNPVGRSRTDPSLSHRWGARTRSTPDPCTGSRTTR